MLTKRLRSLCANHPLTLLHIHLVTQDHERKGFGVHRTRLDQELVSPRVEGVEGLGVVDIIDEDAAICASVERDAEGLETFLAGRVPQLHGHEAIVDEDFFGEEVGADGGFVGLGELLVDL